MRLIIPAAEEDKSRVRFVREYFFFTIQNVLPNLY